MISQVSSISTNLHHWYHPLSLENCLDTQTPSQRVLAIALLVFSGLLTFGIAPSFIIGASIYKVILIKDEHEQREKYINSYSLDNEIEKIKNLKKQFPDKEICLFIGRAFNEMLPQEENRIFISLNDYWEHSQNSYDESNRYFVPVKERIHLKMDINNYLDFKKVQNLFNIVFVDNSTLKFIGPSNFIKPCSKYKIKPEYVQNPFRLLSDLLVPSEKSMVVTEAIASQNTFADLSDPTYKPNDDDTSFKTGRVALYSGDIFDSLEPTSDQQTNPSLFVHGGITYIKKTDKECNKLFDEKVKIVLEKMSLYLESLYDSVELIKNEFYPHPNSKNEIYKTDYFILKGPKKKLKKNLKNNLN